MEKSRIMWIEVLRIAACFAVVLLHINVRWLYSVPIYTLEWHVLNFWNSITRFAVPVFFMISGLLYLEPTKKITIGNLYKRYIGKLFVSYWCWRVLYGIFDVIVYYEMRMEAGALIKEIFKTAILSPRMHMWYLPTLIGILAVCPLLKLITEKKNMQLLAYCVLLFLIFGVLRNTVQLFRFPHKELIISIFNAISPEMLTGCTGFFLLGYFMDQCKWSKMTESVLYLAGGLSVFAATFLNAYRTLVNGSTMTDFCIDNVTVFPCVFAAAVFLFFKKKVHVENIESHNRFILKVSRCTLGIYIIHPFWIDMLDKEGVLRNLNLWPAIPILGLLIFIGSYMVIRLLKMIPYVGNWIV